MDSSELSKVQQKLSDLNADGKVDENDLNLLKQIISVTIKNCPADTNKDGFVNENNSIKYSGYYYDAETGLYYLNSRFYDPENARFMQEDSYDGDVYDPLSLNLYTYCANNPISYYDPTGHSLKKIVKTAKKVYNVAKAVVTASKPVVKKEIKEYTKLKVNADLKCILSPIADAAKFVKKKTETLRSEYQTVLDAFKIDTFSPEVNAWANYEQGMYDTIDNQINGFIQLSDNPADIIAYSVKDFLSDPWKKNPVYAVYQYCKDLGKAVSEKDWNTASYKLGVGVVNTAEVVASAYIGGKIGGKIPTGKVPVPKASVFSRIDTAIDNIFPPTAVTTTGVSVPIPAAVDASIAATTSAGSLGVSGSVAAGSVAGSNIFYSGKGSGQSSGGEIPKSKIDSQLHDEAHNAARYEKLKKTLGTTESANSIMENLM